MVEKEHVIREVRSHDEHESYITSVCSCGWVGRTLSNMHNFQLHEVAKDKRQHLDNQKVLKK